ncbi:flagellar hook-associated protein 1 FlgK [Gammaproteobacteria bacterium]
MPDALLIGITGLRASQIGLNTAGHNIANVNTDSYSRQRAEFGTPIPEFSGGSWLGTGVKTLEVKRIYDEHLTRQLRNTQAATSEIDTYYTQASRIDNLLADPTVGLDSAMQHFFNALHGVGDDPSSIPARQLLINESTNLVDRFGYLQTQFTDAQTRINQGLEDDVNEVNALAKNIAGLNTQIVAAQGQSASQNSGDLLDQRDQLLKKLSTYINVSVLSQADGSINVYMGQGQSLVLGYRSHTLAVTAAADDPTQKEITYYDNNMTGQTIPSSQLTGGEIGGYLRTQDEVVVPAQNALGRVAQGLVADINAQHQLGLDLKGNLGGLFFNAVDTGQGVVNKNNTGSGSVDWQVTDSSLLTTSDYKLSYDGSNYSITRLSDGTIFTPPPTDPTSGNYSLDGVEFTINGSPNAGDFFQLQPTRRAAGLMGIALGNPEEVAAASQINVVKGASNTGTGEMGLPQISEVHTAPVDMTNDTIDFTYDATIPGYTVVNNGAGGHVIWPDTFAYDPTIDQNGKTISLQIYDPTVTTPPPAGTSPLFTLTMKLSGVPQATTPDTFTIQHNPTPALSDNRNALLLGGLQQGGRLVGGTATYQKANTQMVSDVGSRTSYANIDYESQKTMLQRAQEARDSVSGVNLDEEAANLMRFQQAYQASAQVIKTASSLFNTLISAVG